MLTNVSKNVEMSADKQATPNRHPRVRVLLPSQGRWKIERAQPCAPLPEEISPVGRRSENLFKRNDVMRAINSARDAGVPVATVEIVAKDGTIFRMHGPDARQGAAGQPVIEVAAKRRSDVGKPRAPRRTLQAKGAPQ
jgi:hypothetical protein